MTKTNLVILYKKEKDPKVKERLLLAIRVRADEQVPFRVVKEINRSNPWASYWLKRYDEEGIEGLKDRPKSGRHPKISIQTEYLIRTILKESDQGWTTKQVEQMIVEKTGVKYHYTHIYHVLRKWGFRQKVPRKVHINNTPLQGKRKRFSKKDPQDSCGYPQSRTERLCHSIIG